MKDAARPTTVDDPFKRSAFGAVLFCKGPRAALIWLEKAFGFEPSMVHARRLSGWAIYGSKAGTDSVIGLNFSKGCGFELYGLRTNSSGRCHEYQENV
ncbi:hypothetical protein MesoLjLa_00380 [Mesorhizobium sp. L-2-11]|nr:hypothetical protein MesoLjLa_00380 [Mesorhizobium sp. L-2-11]